MKRRKRRRNSPDESRNNEMITHGIQTPRLTEFTKHDVVDSIALNFSRAFRQHLAHHNDVLDVDRFVDWLDISTEWDFFDETDSSSCFARINPGVDDLIQINQNYQDLFETRPDVYRVCLCHEIGHLVLGHCSYFATANHPSLFEDDDSKPSNFLHKNSWAQYGLSSQDVRKHQLALKKAQEQLVKIAIVDPKANQNLRDLNDKFEPEWMFWQAEHFSRCITIPSDRLFKILDSRPLFSGWRSIGELASVFEVPLGTMKTRLTKLKLITMDENGVPSPTRTPQETQLLL